MAYPWRDLHPWPWTRDAKPTPLRMDGHGAPNYSVASSTHLCNTRKVTGRSELDNDVHEELCRQGDEHHQSVPREAHTKFTQTMYIHKVQYLINRFFNPWLLHWEAIAAHPLASSTYHWALAPPEPQ